MTTTRGAIIDLDGTVYRGETLIHGADEGIRSLRDAGYDVLFLTNAAVSSRQAYSEKLNAIGIPASPDDILSSGVVTANYLADTYPESTAMVVGEEPLREELRAAGIEVTDGSNIVDVLVSSLDRSISYQTLTRALRAMDDETVLVATNPDQTRPLEDGEAPSTAAITGAISGMTGREPDIVVGKPSPVTTDIALDLLETSAERCLLVGDRLETDIRMGAAAGMTTALVLSGVTDRETVQTASVTPDHVLDSLGEIDSVLTE